MSTQNIVDDPIRFAAILRAEPFNLSASFASELANGRKKPSLDLAVRIERILSIPAAFWVSSIPSPEAALPATICGASASTLPDAAEHPHDEEVEAVFSDSKGSGRDMAPSLAGAK